MKGQNTARPRDVFACFSDSNGELTYDVYLVIMRFMQKAKNNVWLRSLAVGV